MDCILHCSPFSLKMFLWIKAVCLRHLQLLWMETVAGRSEGAPRKEGHKAGAETLRALAAIALKSVLRH